MHVALHRTTGISAFGRWLAPVVATTTAASATAGLLALWLAHSLAALAAELVCALAVAVLVARVTGLVEERDVQLVGRSMPRIAGPLRLMLR
jgi:hypothetical protein